MRARVGICIFVTRKIAHAAAMIKAGRQRNLELGNLEAKPDWSFAGDFVRAMALITQHHEPDDYVLASGISHTVADFCELAFGQVGLDYRDFVNATFARPSDTAERAGNAAKAKKNLGWRAEVDFETLVSMMVDYYVALSRNEWEVADESD